MADFTLSFAKLGAKDDLDDIVGTVEAPIVSITKESTATEEPTEFMWPIRQLTDKETSGSWCLPCLYDTGQIGRKRSWQIGYSEADNHFYTMHGFVGGKLQIDPRAVVVKGGKSNQQQAWQDAKYKYSCKWRKGHRTGGSSASVNIPAQEAIKYTEKTKLELPVWTGPKLDGIRCRIFLMDGKCIAYTRNNKLFNQSFFANQLAEITQLFQYLPPDVGLDGEWYSEHLTFGEIQGACLRSTNYSPNLEKIQLWIFDVILVETTLEERWTMFAEVCNQYLADHGSFKYIRVVNKELANSHEDIMTAHNKYVEQGFEGAMIRHPASSIKIARNKKYSYYLGKRNKALIKVKAFKEDEFKVTNIYEAAGRDVGTAIIELTLEGKTFTCRPGGSLAERKEILDNKHKYIGQWYTVKYFDKTEDGSLRFPTGKGFRDLRDVGPDHPALQESGVIVPQSIPPTVQGQGTWSATLIKSATKS